MCGGRKRPQNSKVGAKSAPKMSKWGQKAVSYTHLDIENKDGKVIVKADTQIERTVTGKDGKAEFTSDLPLGQYYVKEDVYKRQS